MRPELSDALFRLVRSIQLLAWWRSPVIAEQANGGVGVSQVSSRLSVMDDAILGVGEKQVRSMAALNEELLALVREAASARDPQSLLEAELKIAARWKQCASECSLAWLEAGDWSKWISMPLCDAGAAQPGDSTRPPVNTQYAGLRCHRPGGDNVAALLVRDGPPAEIR